MRAVHDKIDSMHHLLRATYLFKKAFLQFKQINGLLKDEKPTSAFNCRKSFIHYATVRKKDELQKLPSVLYLGALFMRVNAAD
jgi:hypothetical protein